MIPLCVVSLDRRRLHGDGVEQWRYDGPTVRRALDACGRVDAFLDAILAGVELPARGTRFIVYAGFRITRDACGAVDEVLVGCKVVACGS